MQFAYTSVQILCSKPVFSAEDTYVQLCLLVKIWYLAQIFPPTHPHAQQLTTICSWFIWQGATFRVPMTILKRPKHDGGWDFPNVEIKGKTLLYNRIQMMGARKELPCRNSCAHGTSHAHQRTRLRPVGCRPSWPIFAYISLMWFTVPIHECETRKSFKRRVYEVLLRLANNASTTSAI
jgi:hypothetical protein